MRESVRAMGAGGISGIGVGDRMASRDGKKLGYMSGDAQRPR
jgi:hypothetical protein